MAWISLLVLVLSCALISVSALDINGNIRWNDVCSGFEELRSSKVVLDSGTMHGGVMRNGSFVIPDVPVGTHILSVISPDHSFDQLRIDILDSNPVPEVRPYVAGTPLNPISSILLSYPIALVPRKKHVYFIPPETFNLVAMFSNPMMLLMVFGGGMMLVMPYLMKNMDPEAMEELKEQHAKVAGMQNAITGGDFKSGISALLGSDESPSTAGPPSSVVKAPASKGRNKNNKKR